MVTGPLSPARLSWALPAHLDAIHRMGHDAWGGTRSVDDYLAACRANRKYASGRWLVLLIDDQPVSSALIHDLRVSPPLIVRGIGSLATVPALRRRGHGQELVRRALRLLLDEERAAIVYLYADIDPGFYARLGFAALPDACQRHLPSVLMAAYGETCPAAARDAPEVPGYF